MNQDTAQNIEQLYRAAAEMCACLLEGVRVRTENGRGIDDHQVLTRRLAHLATRLEAAKSLKEYAADYPGDMAEAEAIAEVARLFCGEVLADFAIELDLYNDNYRLEHPGLSDDERTALRDTLRVERYADIGGRALEGRGANTRWIETGQGSSENEDELRRATRSFAKEVVAPEAEAIHRQDLLIPEHFIKQMSELGYFGMSVPEEYGGVGMSALMMVLATEELSAASLSAAGSLITRPEILTRALLRGGTEEQKATWLPRIASGETMVAISVTEPNTGSDVASVSCRATEATQDGVAGYLLNGAKAWCTFAGRANILALLARTDPNTSLGHKGLSLFIVEKDVFEGHDFVMEQPGGGRIAGKADATLGYRGMHSFTLQIEDYFVPAENLVGGDSGVGRGFYLQMDGFAAGRLQTGGRAVGLAQASLETAVQYVLERPQFGQPIANFQSTQFEIGKMAVQVEAARQLTYAAARATDASDPRSNLLSAMAKLFACRIAVDVSQRAQLLHGGWGYAEEYAISRYVVDALVLPIFEGVEPILEMKVIGRALLSD